MKNMLRLLLLLSLSLFLVACKQTPEEPAPVAKPRIAVQISTGVPEKNDIEERSTFMQDVRTLLKQGEYDKLEAMEAELRSSRARFAGGDWKLERFLQALGNPEGAVRNQPTKEELEAHLALVQKWVGARPQSVHAQVTLADVLVSLAWDERGRGFAEAEALLQKVKDNRKECLDWYLAMNDVARGSGWSISEYNKHFDEAIAVEPLFFAFHFDKATFLLPRWHGQPGDVLAFAEESAKQAGGEEGEILFTRICWIWHRHEGGSDFYTQSKVAWPRIKNGFILIEKNYGASYRQMNAFVLMAGSARDVRAVQALFNRIGENWEPDFWKNKSHYDEYRDWAFGR